MPWATWSTHDTRALMQKAVAVGKFYLCKHVAATQFCIKTRQHTWEEATDSDHMYKMWLRKETRVKRLYEETKHDSNFYKRWSPQWWLSFRDSPCCHLNTVAFTPQCCRQVIFCCEQKEHWSEQMSSKLILSRHSQCNIHWRHLVTLSEIWVRRSNRSTLHLAR